MLIQINMDLLAMVLYLMHVHNFHFQMLNEVKMLLILESIIDFMCMPTVVLGEGLIGELDNATTTVELNILLILSDQKKV